MACSLFLLSCFLTQAQAYKTFQANCTFPSTEVNFVSSNNTRGTIDILWSCLFTIVACTWTVQHLNVPEQRDDRDKGWRGDIKWALKRTRTSAKWMLATALAPEILISKSLGDLLDVKINMGRLRELAKEDDVPWSRTHSLFANMGGFVIRGNVPERVGNLEDPKTKSSPGSEPHPSKTEAAFSVPEAQRPSREDNLHHIRGLVNLESSSLPEHADPYHIVAADLVALREAGLLKRLPYIPIAELNDKSKSDSLVRFIAVTQILWIGIQIIIRASRHLAISQLEVAVVAFSICAIIIYCLNWEKPKGVQIPYTVLQYRSDIPRPVLECCGEWRRSTAPGLYDVLTGMSFRFSSAMDQVPGSRIQNDLTPSPDESEGDYGQIVGLLIGGMVFSAVHIAAWHFVFPNNVEQRLWWAASIVSTCAPIPLTFLITVVFSRMQNASDVTLFLLTICLFHVPIFLYLAARLFLLVEIFRTLLFLPPSAYVSTWAANVPHVA